MSAWSFVKSSTTAMRLSEPVGSPLPTDVAVNEECETADRVVTQHSSLKEKKGIDR